MTRIKEYEIIEEQEVGGTFSKIKNRVLFKKKDCIFTVKLTVLTSVGYEPGCLLMLDNYDKVVVISSTGKEVVVQTIKPLKEFKDTKAVLTLLTRSWAGI